MITTIFEVVCLFLFREHEQYVKEMLKDYVPRPNYSTLLDQAVTGHNDSNHGLYVIMTGEAGSGKSSLLADWWNKFKINSSFIFFIGNPFHMYGNSFAYTIGRIVSIFEQS